MNPISLLQQQVVGRLTQDDAIVPSLVPANGEIMWLTEDKGDLANIIARAVGKMGIVATVLTPGGGKLFHAGVPYPISFDCPIEIQIQENVTVNRGAAGTQIPVLDVVVFCFKRLHLWSPTGQKLNKITCAEKPWQLVTEVPILVYNALFDAKVTIQ